jgi:uncharacterized coiled-coil DUF342 family protein
LPTRTLRRCAGEVAALRAKAESAEQAHQEQRKTAAQEAHRAAERLAATQMERDEARKEIGKAREEASNWRGQVEALKEQQRGLLEAVKTGRVAVQRPKMISPKTDKVEELASIRKPSLKIQLRPIVLDLHAVFTLQVVNFIVHAALPDSHVAALLDRINP